MRIANHLGIALALFACVASGCHMFPEKHPFGQAQGHSPLKPAQPSPDSVGMEIIWARFPANDPALSDTVWREIDEAQIDPVVRRELVNNGFRAGIICGAMPEAISSVLHSGETTTESSSKDASAANGVELLTDPVVHGRKCRLRRNQRTEIQASELYPSMPLLLSGDSGLGGRPYSQAQAVYALRVDPRPDRSVAVSLTPEIHHGSPRTKFVGDEAMLRLETQREREVFEKLRVSVKLAPGDSLVLMSLPDAGSRLGHFFHNVESSDGTQQKLILIRLADVPPSDSYAENAK